MSGPTTYPDWMSPADCLVEIRKARPESHPGKELTTSAMMAGFRMKARRAVFMSTDGSGHIVERRSDLEIAPAWSHPTFEDRDHRGLQWIDLDKAEALLIPPQPEQRQQVMLYGISYHRDDVAEHFGIDLGATPAVRPSRGFADSDRELLVQMREWIERTGRGVTAASEEFAGEAAGGGNLASRAKRLERRYLEETEGE